MIEFHKFTIISTYHVCCANSSDIKNLIGFNKIGNFKSRFHLGNTLIKPVLRSLEEFLFSQSLLYEDSSFSFLH